MAPHPRYRSIRCRLPVTRSRRELEYNAGLRPKMLMGFHSISVGEGNGGLFIVRSSAQPHRRKPPTTYTRSWTSEIGRVFGLFRGWVSGVGKGGNRRDKDDPYFGMKKSSTGE